MSQKITQILKQSILNLEAALGDVHRIVFNKCSGKSWTDANWNFFSTKGVKHDAVYLYDISLNDGSCVLGLSFNFLKSQYYTPSIIPKQHQNVSFSYCLNNGNEKKQIQHSKAFNIDEARDILKKLRKALILSNYNANQFTVEQFVNIIETEVFNFEFGNISERIETVKNDVQKYKVKSAEINQDFIQAENDFKKTLLSISYAIKNSDEQKLVDELEAQLRKARASLANRKKEIQEIFELKAKESKFGQLGKNRTDIAVEYEKATLLSMEKNNVPVRLKGEIK